MYKDQVKASLCPAPGCGSLFVAAHPVPDQLCDNLGIRFRKFPNLPLQYVLTGFRAFSRKALNLKIFLVFSAVSACAVFFHAAFLCIVVFFGRRRRHRKRARSSRLCAPAARAGGKQRNRQQDQKQYAERNNQENEHIPLALYHDRSVVAQTAAARGTLERERNRHKGNLSEIGADRVCDHVLPLLGIRLRKPRRVHHDRCRNIIVAVAVLFDLLNLLVYEIIDLSLPLIKEFVSLPDLERGIIGRNIRVHRRADQPAVPRRAAARGSPVLVADHAAAVPLLVYRGSVLPCAA